MTTRSIQQLIPAGYTGTLDLAVGSPSPSNICAIAVDVNGMSGTMIPRYRMLTDGIAGYTASYRNCSYVNVPTLTQYAAGTAITADGTYEFPADAGIIAMNVTVAPSADVTLTIRLLDGPAVSGALSTAATEATLALLKPATIGETVTPSNSVNLAAPSRSLWVGGAGDVTAVMNGVAVTFPSVPAGTVLPIVVTRINSTGTTATNMVSLS